MAASRPSRPQLALASFGVALLAAIAAPPAPSQGAAAPRAGSPTGPVSLEAASSDVDYKSNTVVFRDVVITQGSIRVSAAQARATGLNFENAAWSFTGRVRITVDGGELTSDEATVDFRSNRITRASIAGRPAQFQQARPGTGEIARGRAGSILYDVPGGTITLNRDAWLSDGRNEISGQQLVYDVRSQRVQAQSAPGTASDRVRITIRPREGAEPAPP